MSRNLYLLAAALLLTFSPLDASAKRPAAATGGGKIELGDGHQDVSFNVRGDGHDARGHANLLIRESGKEYHVVVEVDCLAIESDTTAVVSGEIVGSDGPDGFEQGNTVRFVVEDNDESDPSIDRQSPIELGLECTDGELPLLHELAGGDVTVEP